ncbi:hypothetical protein K501DRAFT_302263 [Backusella circina FSU 941]|nr:hypothetical protein K501DRAFT_302263 [Backusella circina FSU 941]
MPTTFNNVNRYTFDDLYESILHSVRHASYIALDTEFAGLGSGKGGDLFQLYPCHKEAAEKYSILSLGLTVVQKVNNNTTKELHYKADNYNFTTLKRNGFIVETDTGLFLTENNFSFDDLFLNGIEFEPVRKLTSAKYSKLSNLWHDMIRVMNDRNIALVSFIGVLPDTINGFVDALADTFKGGIFDTKFIAKSVANEKSSYLEYLFRRYDRILEYRFNTDKIYFKFESNPPIIATNHTHQQQQQ